MPIDFPINPSIGTTHSISTNEWIYDGYGWKAKDISSNYVQSFNGLTGTIQGVSAAIAGTGISVSGATGSVTITNTGVRSFNGFTGAVSGVSSLNTYTNNITIGYGSGITVSPVTTDESGNVSWVISNSGVLSFNGSNGAIQGVSAAVAGSGISISGATGTVTITNSGVTGIRGGTGISVSSTTGYPTIGVTLASGQSFIGADVNLTTASTWYNVTGLTLDVGTWFVTGNLTCLRGGSGTRVFSIQLVDTTPTTYASAAQGLASVSGNSVQIACSAIVTLATSKRINLQGMTNTTSTPSDYAGYYEPQVGALNASGIVAFRIA